MRGLLQSIPLPLRIAGLILLVLLVYGLLGKALSSLMLSLAVALWIISLLAWMYDQGWVNPLARVPVLSSFLGFMTNRAEILTQPDKNDKSTPPPGELNDDERRKLYSAARERIAGLQGNDAARELIYQRIIDPAAANPDNPFASNAPAAIVFIAGPRGIGKTTVAQAIAHLLVGVGASKTAKIVSVRPTDLRGGEFGSAIELGRKKAVAAKGGALLVDDAEWLLAPDPYGGQDSPGLDFGMTVVDVLRQAPGETVVIATLDEQSLGRLKEDAGHARWLGKLARREILFDDLDDDALVDILALSLKAMGWSFEDDDTADAARRLLVDMRDRKGASFDNADACRRTAEILVEITNEEFPDLANKRIVGREVVRLTDEEME
jgi:energy-coupling factor transporter ATP-binding protein EcfA2